MDRQVVEEHLSGVIKGEISAVETYRQALSKLDAEPQSTVLSKIAEDHEDAVDILKELAHYEGGMIPQDSGMWGAWAQAVEGTAQIFGDKAAIKALKEGEEHGVKLYQKTLRDRHLTNEARDTIRDMLLPQTSAHVSMLNRLLAAHRTAHHH